MVLNENIWKEIQEGNENAFEYIFETYWTDLFKKAYRFTKSESEAKDVVQDLFLKLWEHRNELKIENSVGGYLFAALKFRLLNYARKGAILEHHLSIWANLQEQSSPITNSHLLERELKEIILLECEKLSPAEKKVFLLHRINGISIDEIAHILNLKNQTIRNYLSTASRKIKESLLNHIHSLL